MRKHNINYKLFNDINQPKVAYFLGLLWADGTIRSKYGRVKIYAKKEDLSSINDIFDFLGSWSIWENDDKINKIRLEYSVNNIDFYNFLLENDYLDKSIKSPNKILLKIPKNLHYLFYRGWLDGDGCIFTSKNGKSMKISFAGNVEQDWEALINLCNELHISYKIFKQYSNNGNGSYFNITKHRDMIIFGFYLYKSFEFGFKRKFFKYIELLKIITNIKLNKKGYYYDNFYKCYKCSSSKISGKCFSSEDEIKKFIYEYRAINNDDSIYFNNVLNYFTTTYLTLLKESKLFPPE